MLSGMVRILSPAVSARGGSSRPYICTPAPSTILPCSPPPPPTTREPPSIYIRRLFVLPAPHFVMELIHHMNLCWWKSAKVSPDSQSLFISALRHPFGQVALSFLRVILVLRLSFVLQWLHFFSFTSFFHLFFLLHLFLLLQLLPQSLLSTTSPPSPSSLLSPSSALSSQSSQSPLSPVSHFLPVFRQL